MSLRLAIVASGNGTNAQAIMDAARSRALDASIRLVLCNRPEAPVLDRACRAGAPHLLLDPAAHSGRAAYERAMIEAIRASGADTVALAGYMRLLGPEFLRAFPGRLLNVHPALLPAFPGMRGVADAHAWGVAIAGCTVHFVDEEPDHGAIIIQAAVPRLSDEDPDALARRIHSLEHRIYPQALQWLAAGRIRVRGRHVRIDDAGRTPAPVPDSALVWPPLEEGF